MKSARTQATRTHPTTMSKKDLIEHLRQRLASDPRWALRALIRIYQNQTADEIDPALRNTGYAVLERLGRETKALTWGVINNPAARRQSQCLVAIREELHRVIRDHQPHVCAVEGIIFVQSYKTAIIMGAARGAALLAAAEHDLEIYEYAPRRVKQAVVGKGAAQKQQVAFMIRALLGLTETPPPDAADAIAIGLTHFQTDDPLKNATGIMTRV